MGLGLLPKIGAITTVIPTSVLGGAMIAMFGMVLANGIKLLSKVDYTEQANLLIIACSIGMDSVSQLFQSCLDNYQLVLAS